MTWGAIGGAAVSVVGGALMSDGGGGGGGGGAGSQTASKEPWGPLQPWIMGNAISGQNLQNAYTAQPFSGLQNQAYANQNNQSAYMRAAVPSLLGQISGQQVGFDRSNPNLRPNAFSFDGLMAANKAGQGAASANQQQQAGLLAMLNAGLGANSDPKSNTPQIAPPPAPAQGTFMQQPGMVTGMNYSGQGGPQGLMGTGGYGTFKYGMEMPQPGTPQYRDMSEYFANGGADPNNYYGRAATNPYNDPKANPLAYMFTSGYGGLGGSSTGIDGIGVAGSDAAVGSSANF